MDPVQCCTHPTDLFRLIGNPIVFSMNVDLELYSSSPTLHPTPLHPFNTDEILLILYTRRWVYLFPQNRKRGRRKKRKKQGRTIRRSCSDCPLKFKCSTLCVPCNMRVYAAMRRRYYLVKSSCQL